MNIVRNFFILFFLIFPVGIHAQFYDLGQDPVSVKWRVIKTEHFKIIFPAEIESEAQHIAGSFEKVYEQLSSDMKIKPVKIPVVLHNRAILSNAEVPWAPKRIEFFMCPAQDDYPQPWIDQLVLHEFRHVVHYSKINQGLTKVLSYFFGQQITAGVIGTFVPLWFIEGDAVCTETAYSSSGRGRMPWFTMKTRAQVMEKGIYNYNKSVFGSYKTFTPDRYEMGYQLVAYGQKYYSTELWEQAMDKSGKLPLMVIPFNYGLKKVSKLNKTKLYRNCFSELDSLWKWQASQTNKSNYTLLSNKKNKFYTNYHFCHASNGGSYITVRSGMDDITRFVRIDSSGKERKIFTPGSYLNTSFSVNKNKLIWAETAYDPRWENRTYSVIKTYDLINKRIKQLSHRSRYFAPSLDKSNTKIVCTENTIDNQSFIVTLNAENGNVIQRIAADTGDFIMTPKWSETGKEIVFIALNRFGKRICIVDESGEKRNLTSPSFIEINQPCLSGEYVFFVGGFSGISNIYALDTTLKEIFQITSSKFGVSDPVISDDGKELLYSDYTADGYRPVKITIDSGLWVPLNNIRDLSEKQHQYLFGGKAAVIDFYQNDKKKYFSKRYSKLLNLFNIHSWGPLSINADNATFKPGFEIKSQNLLSTMFFSAGYEHEWNKPQSQVFARLSYRGWYPHIDLNFLYRFNWQDSIRWDIMAWQLGIKVPLNLTKGKDIVFIQPQIRFGYYDIIPLKNFPDGSFSGSLKTLEYRLYGYHIIKTSLKDINPRWGQLLEFTYNHTPFSKKKYGEIFGVQGILFFPGIGRHHSLSIYGGWQQNSAEKFVFNDIVTYPHGYDSSGYKKTVTGKLTYLMPLFYPDWSIGSLLYIKRFRAGFYYDHAYVADKNNNRYTLNSAGMALLADFHLLRFIAPLSMGVRLTYRFDINKLLPEFLYTVNFDELRFRPVFSREQE